MQCDTPYRKPVSHLTAAQEERLDHLIEEAAEIIKAACKIQRHGYHSKGPNGQTNLERLTDELGDLVLSVERLNQKDDLGFCFNHALRDIERLWHEKKRYFHHQSS